MELENSISTSKSTLSLKQTQGCLSIFIIKTRKKLNVYKRLIYLLGGFEESMKIEILNGMMCLKTKLNMMKYMFLKREIEHALQIMMPGLLTTDGRKHPGQPTADLPLDSPEATIKS